MDACQFFHICASCGVRLRPKMGDCCVFCSYGGAALPTSSGRPRLLWEVIRKHRLGTQETALRPTPIQRGTDAA